MRVHISTGPLLLRAWDRQTGAIAGSGRKVTYVFGGSKLFTETRRTQAMRMRLLNLASVVPRSMRWIVDLSMPARSASRSCVRFS